MKRLCVGLFVAIVMLGAGHAEAGEVANCGSSKGYAYYPKVGAAANETVSGTWSKDGISNGRFSLTVSEKKEFDVLFVDASGGIYSSSSGGGKVIHLGQGENIISVLVVYPNISSETYTFYRTVEGEAEMMWTQSKYGSPIPKVAAFVASCSFLAF